MKAYGHSLSTHGPTRAAEAFQDRAKKTGHDQGQWYDDQHIVEAEQWAQLSPGAHDFDMGRPIGRVFCPDGRVVETQRARVIRKDDLTVKTYYPIQ